MTAATKPATRTIEAVMEEASAALSRGDYFASERLCAKAMQSAFVRGEFELVARIALPLQEARRQRRLMAIEADRIFVFEKDPPSGESKLRPGCYVVCAPLVAADARRIAEAAFEQRVPVLALAVEPRTRLGLLPLAVVGATTIRAKMRPPRAFTPRWCLEAVEALTDSALETFDPGRALHRQVEDLVEKVMTLPESELLHQKLAEVAHQAAHGDASAHAAAEAPVRARPRRPARGKAGHKGPRKARRDR